MVATKYETNQDYREGYDLGRNHGRSEVLDQVWEILDQETNINDARLEVLRYAKELKEAR